MTILKGSLVNLRPPVVEDAAVWYEWLNDFDVMLTLGDEVYDKFSMGSVREMIETHAAQNYFMFTIETKEHQPIGRCILFNVDHLNDKAGIGIFLGDRDSWGKGFAKEAMALLIEYGFKILNLQSIFLGVFAFNSRAIKLYESLGFKKIGVRRQARKINGEYHDVIFMDLLADEFEGQFLDISMLK